MQRRDSSRQDTKPDPLACLVTRRFLSGANILGLGEFPDTVLFRVEPGKRHQSFDLGPGLTPSAAFYIGDIAVTDGLAANVFISFWRSRSASAGPKTSTRVPRESLQEPCNPASHAVDIREWDRSRGGDATPPASRAMRR